MSGEPLLLVRIRDLKFFDADLDRRVGVSGLDGAELVGLAAFDAGDLPAGKGTLGRYFGHAQNTGARRQSGE
jgi:hypothetical protein